MVATKDAYGKVYVRLNTGEIVTVKTFLKRYPEKAGLQMTEIMESLKTRKEVLING